MTFPALSAIDHVYASEALDPMPLIFHYGSPLKADLVERAFWDTAHEFVGVAGTLGRCDEHTLGFDLSRDRAAFRVIDADGQTPAREFIEPLETRVGGPLARAYLIRRPDGSASIGLSLAHVLADGYGFFLFAAAWAARARGARLPPPNCDRSLLSAPSARVPAAQPPAPGELPQSRMMLLEQEFAAPRLRWKEEFIEEGSQDWPVSERVSGVSANDVLCAMLWKRAVAEQRSEHSTFICYVDVRRHIAALGPLYFGNAIVIASVTKATAELRAMDRVELAQEIRTAVEEAPARTPAIVAELESLRATAGLDVFRRLRSFPPNGFTVTNMSRAPMPALDFGAGVPRELEVAQEPPRAEGCLVLAAPRGLRLVVATR